MKILMGLWHLAGDDGTQTWAYTLAREFRKLGHSVSFYSGGKGKMGMRLLGEGFPVYTVGDRLPTVDV